MARFGPIGNREGVFDWLGSSIPSQVSRAISIGTDVLAVVAGCFISKLGEARNDWIERAGWWWRGRARGDVNRNVVNPLGGGELRVAAVRVEIEDNRGGIGFTVLGMIDGDRHVNPTVAGGAGDSGPSELDV